MIIAVDGGLYNIGVAILSKDAEILEYKYIQINNKIKYHPNILNNIYLKLHDVIQYYRNSICVYESPNIHNKARSAYGHLKMIGVLELLCGGSLNIEVKSSVVATHWKKVVLGDGKSSKEDVMNYVKSEYLSIGEISQHEADAICIGLCWIKENKC